MSSTPQMCYDGRNDIVKRDLLIQTKRFFYALLPLSHIYSYDVLELPRSDQGAVK